MSKSTNCEKCAHHPICEWCDKHIITFRFPQGNNVCEFFRAYAPQSEWISVDERLPEPFVSVLTYMPGEAPHPTVHEGYLNKRGKWYAGGFDRLPDEVVMWMPLPEPPITDKPTQEQ